MEFNEDPSSSINRDEIRTNLSQMSFEDLQKLKEKIGAKLYNETVHGPNFKKRKHIQTDYKRANKNRPREMSSKCPQRIQNDLISVKKVTPRDPRFDPLCGAFNEQIFKKSYKFVDEIKVTEREMLREELGKTRDPKRQKKIKYLIQRMDNQLREKTRRDKEEERSVEEKKLIKETLKKGEKPEYQKKSEKKIMNLMTQYKELKQNNQLKKHIEKKSKKEAKKHKFD